MLDSSSIHRRLDSKVKIMGLEVHDLLFILLFAAIMNLIFGQTALGTIMVFVVPSLLAICLYFAKRNRPENYLIHLLKFHLEPGYLSAGDEGEFERKRMRKAYK